MTIRLSKDVIKVDNIGLRNSLSVWYLQNILKKAPYPLHIGDLVKFLDKEDRPRSVINAGKQAIEKWRGYTHSNGLEEIRKVVAKYWFNNESKYNNVILTNGATGAMYLLAWAIKPRYVAIPEFSYPTWFTSIYKEGGKIVSMKRDKNSQISKEAIASLNKDIDYIVIIPFDNPTGVIINKKTIKAIINKLKKIRKEDGKTIPLILDMEYYDLVFDKKAYEMKKAYDFGKEWIIAYTWSLSKSISGPEWRSGFIAIDYPKAMQEEGIKFINALSIMNSDSLGINISAQFMLKQTMEDFIKKGEAYKKRELVRQKVAKRVLDNYKTLSKIPGLTFMKKPKAAFYSIITLNNTKPWKSNKLKQSIWNKFKKKAKEADKFKLFKEAFENKSINNYSLSEVYALDLAIEKGIIVVPYDRFNINANKNTIGFRVVIPHKQDLIKKCAKEWQAFHKKRGLY